MHKLTQTRGTKATLIILILSLLIMACFVISRYSKNDHLVDYQPVKHEGKKLEDMNLAIATKNIIFFESWAQPNDVLVFWGDDFDKIPKLKTGRIGWNVPSFAHVKDTESRWKGKVDILIYDYETWENTPESEQQNSEETAKQLQEYAKAKDVELIIGCSFKMITLPKSRQDYESNREFTNWDKLINKKKIEDIVRNVDNFGVNGVGLRTDNPNSYISFFNAIGKYAREVNPEIKLWPVLDARTETGKQMYELVNGFSVPIEGVTIMGSDESVLSEFIELTRGL